MLVLLPPSEGKAQPEAGEPVDLGSLAFAEELGERREQLLDALRPGLREAPAAPAAEVYTGVLLRAAGAARAAGEGAAAGADRQRALGRGAAR